MRNAVAMTKNMSEGDNPSAISAPQPSAGSDSIATSTDLSSDTPDSSSEATSTSARKVKSRSQILKPKRIRPTREKTESNAPAGSASGSSSASENPIVGNSQLQGDQSSTPQDKPSKKDSRTKTEKVPRDEGSRRDMKTNKARKAESLSGKRKSKEETHLVREIRLSWRVVIYNVVAQESSACVVCELDDETDSLVLCHGGCFRYGGAC